MISLNKLKSEILPTAFSENGIKFVSCLVQDEKSGEDQFASDVVFVKVKVLKENEEVEIPVVVKVEPSCESVRALCNTSTQFYNEVFMYSRVFPLIKKGNGEVDVFPNFYYGIGSVSQPGCNVIILEDLSPQGYQLSESKIQLDFTHLSVALNKLGQFHALSYAAKENSQEEFFKEASLLKEVFCRKDNNKMHEMAKACLHRAIDPLVKAGRHVEILQSFLNMVDNDFCGLLSELVSSNDPLAVICHGDFCRNNVLFKYSDGKPVDVKLFDFATSRLSSPAIDISFLLFLNGSRDLRAAHWDDLLDVYHKSLSSAVPGSKVPSLSKIKTSVQQKGVWGFIHCSFFLPIMLFGLPISIEELTAKEVKDFINIQTKIGGEEGTKLLCELAEELVYRKMFHL